jgi:signal transduction histidine kinase
MLFARQRERTALFGLLIGVSAVAALVGFVTARRAFQRQLRLAEMKSNFVSSVSHELRAPIASVRLMAEGLEHGRIQEPAKQAEYFRFIVQECRRLSSMIENVLDFSRIEQGRKQYEFEPTDLCALVEQTVHLMATPAAERQIRLETVVSGEPISAELDGRAIQQALVNLIDNAVKHSPNSSLIRIGLDFPPSSPQPSPPSEGGEGEESPRTTQHATRNTQHESSFTPHASRFTLWVEDNGEGIPPQEHARIFERFYRCGSELRRETQGVGIGLSIVKHIVEAHGGRIMVRSAVGQGSRFTLELPVRTGEGPSK